MLLLIWLQKKLLLWNLHNFYFINILISRLQLLVLNSQLQNLDEMLSLCKFIKNIEY